jgi:PEP-CTERM motif
MLRKRGGLSTVSLIHLGGFAVRSTLLLTLAASAALFGASAEAAVTLISGAGNPLAAIPGGSQITFESVTPGEYTTLTVGPVTFTPAAGTDEFVNSNYAGQYNTTGQSLQNTYAATAFSTITFSFSSPVAAFAFNYGAADTIWDLSGYDGSTLLGTVMLTPTHGGNAGTYYGLQSSGADITSAVLTVDLPLLSTTLPDYIFIDNFTYSAVTAVPEPATWSMMMIGIAGLGSILRLRARRSISAAARG